MSFWVGESLAYPFIIELCFDRTTAKSFSGFPREVNRPPPLTFRRHWAKLYVLIFETLMGVSRIRLQCGKSGRAPRMTLGLVKNASNHYMANPM